MTKYRKKPVVIEAIQFIHGNEHKCFKFCPQIAYQEYSTRAPLVIKTLEGNMLADSGDYIIKGIKGEFYPCKPDIFEATYEKVDD